MQGQTLAGEVAGADMVLFGSLTNANDTAQTTDLVLEAVVKKNAILDDITQTVDGKKLVTLPKYLPPEVAGAEQVPGLLQRHQQEGNRPLPRHGRAAGQRHGRLPQGRPGAEGQKARPSG